MGEVFHIRCGACSETWRCIMGNGMAYANKANIIAAFSEKERGKVEALLAASEIPAYDFRYGLAVCGYCHSLVSVPMVGLSENDEPYVGNCPLCGRKIKHFCADVENVEVWSKKMACPVCKRKKLEIEEISYWD